MTDPNNPDTDYDGIPDGVEDGTATAGRTATACRCSRRGEPVGRPATTADWPDGEWDALDGASGRETDPNKRDTDEDGASDGYGEDRNFNGWIDGDIELQPRLGGRRALGGDGPAQPRHRRRRAAGRLGAAVRLRSARRRDHRPHQHGRPASARSRNLEHGADGQPGRRYDRGRRRDQRLHQHHGVPERHASADTRHAASRRRRDRLPSGRARCSAC